MHAFVPGGPGILCGLLFMQAQYSAPLILNIIGKRLVSYTEIVVMSRKQWTKKEKQIRDFLTLYPQK